MPGHGSGDDNAQFRLHPTLPGRRCHAERVTRHDPKGGNFTHRTTSGRAGFLRTGWIDLLCRIKQRVRHAATLRPMLSSGPGITHAWTIRSDLCLPTGGTAARIVSGRRVNRIKPSSLVGRDGANRRDLTHLEVLPVPPLFGRCSQEPFPCIWFTHSDDPRTTSVLMQRAMLCLSLSTSRPRRWRTGDARPCQGTCHVACDAASRGCLPAAGSADIPPGKVSLIQRSRSE